MAPPGIKVLIHGRAEYHCLWYSHALSGWFIVPILEHYRFHQIWIPATKSVHIGQNFSWFPHKLTMPTATSTKIIIVTDKNITASLKQTNKHPLFSTSDTITLKSLFQLDSIFSNASYALKSQQSPIFKIPRVSTPKHVAAPPRVYPFTTQNFQNIYPTTQQTLQRYLSHKIQNFSKNIAFSFSIA